MRTQYNWETVYKMKIWNQRLLLFPRPSLSPCSSLCADRLENMAWFRWGYRHRFSLGNSQTVTKMIPDALEQLESLVIVQTCRSDRRLYALRRDFFKREQFSTANLQHTTRVTGFPPKMSFNFPFAWRQQGGLHLASPLSFIPQLVRFQIHAEEYLVVSVPLLCGSTPCGKDAQVWKDLSLLWLTFYQWWKWISPLSTSYLSVTPDDCLWSMKAHSLFFSSSL